MWSPLPVLPFMRLLLIAFIPMAAAAMLRFRVPGAKRLLAISQGDLTRWVPPAQPSAIVVGGVDGAILKAGPTAEVVQALPESRPACGAPRATLFRQKRAVRCSRRTSSCGRTERVRTALEARGRRPSRLTRRNFPPPIVDLRSCVRTRFAAVALPAVSCGVFGYPPTRPHRGGQPSLRISLRRVKALFSDYRDVATAAEDAGATDTRRWPRDAVGFS